MNRSTASSVVFAMTIAVLIAPFMPAFAQFTGGGAQATSWVVELLTPLIPLACIGVAVFAWMGRVNWGWFAAACVGTILFFGRDQFVSLVRSWFSV
jgi:glycerol-3-phosphate acyltransferase PlsY